MYYTYNNILAGRMFIFMAVRQHITFEMNACSSFDKRIVLKRCRMTYYMPEQGAKFLQKKS